MKQSAVLCLWILLSATALATVPGKSVESNDGFEAFRQKFKAAVLSTDKETVIGLSRFPIRMPERVRSIKDAVDLREVFNQDANAVKCFKEKDVEPQRDPNNPKLAEVACLQPTLCLRDCL